ncbi:short chain enoyl-CoA hydratase [Desulfacinum hydrothermale DSM 13146]|uniref:Enoyl-CoA hydratase domain-containing protein 3, mitochondrial n=1 Tax=Desulfacinum hydrothermale DSM 13146 TaxID=1121390 RepID=A0A1W1XUD6_9BACT|nr:enoyl-CoA hydratase [Desulfacinum hydrothermale]SMC27579.1 short chain enoyl-CoA hydratase [Desulfacinum hydrothermale DSM 13146]
MKEVRLERMGPIAHLVLDHPQTRNALSLSVIEAIMTRLDEVGRDPAVRVLILRGEGPAFCAGHNLKEMIAPEADLHAHRRLFSTCSRMMLQLHRLPQIVIAQVHGIATAAGCQLVAACDLAVAESGARFATPGVKIGLFCTTPMVPLVRVIGRRRAMEMLVTGRFVSAQEALDWGLVNRVVPLERLSEETMELAESIASFSRFTLSFGKEAFYSQVDLDEGSAYDFAKEAIAFNCLADDAQEGMRAFVEKRAPIWKHR